ncbi:MAG TPA: cation:proton antiporter [bacterium]|nr:cation:proton antiporter [bacterium]
MQGELTLFFFIFLIIFVARPLSEFLRLPVLLIYLLAGLLLGRTAAGLSVPARTLVYFHQLGLILLMFSAGLDLKLNLLRRTRSAVVKTYLWTGLLPGVAGILLGLLLIRRFPIGGLFAALLLFTVFGSSSVEVMIPFFKEVAPKMKWPQKSFASVLTSATILAEMVILGWFSGLVMLYPSGDFLDLLRFLTFGSLFFFVVIQGLPYLQRLWKRNRAGFLFVEEETRMVMLMLMLVVGLGSLLGIHPLVCGFLAGVSLANVHLNRRGLQHLQFITFSLFVPVVFIGIGAELDPGLFLRKEYCLLPLVLAAGLLLMRAAPTYWLARQASLSVREAAGFAFANISQITGTIATAAAASRLGLISGTFGQAIALAAMAVTFLGPLLARNLLFPGLPHREKKLLTAEDFAHTDLKPVSPTTALTGIIQVARDTELSVYPVADEEGRYLGVIFMDQIKDIVFSEDLDHLVIAADLVNENYPRVFRETPLEQALTLFKQPGISALPVVEECGQEYLYYGMLMLPDLLPGEI